MDIIFALGTACGYGASDFCAGIGGRRSHPVAVAALSQPLSLGVALTALVLLPGRPDGASLAWGGVAGLGIGLGTVFLYVGLAGAPMSVVATLSGVITSLLPALVGVALGARLGAGAYAGIGLAVPASALVSTTCAGQSFFALLPPRRRDRRGSRLRVRHSVHRPAPRWHSSRCLAPGFRGAGRHPPGRNLWASPRLHRSGLACCSAFRGRCRRPRWSRHARLLRGHWVWSAAGGRRARLALSRRHRRDGTRHRRRAMEQAPTARAARQRGIRSADLRGMRGQSTVWVPCESRPRAWCTTTVLGERVLESQHIG